MPSINLIVLGGLGNGTLNAALSDTVTRGYGLSAFVALVSVIARSITKSIASNIAYPPTEVSDTT